MIIDIGPNLVGMFGGAGLLILLGLIIWAYKE